MGKMNKCLLLLFLVIFLVGWSGVVNTKGSTDFGLIWIDRESNRDWRDISISSDGKYQTAVVWGGQIYTSDDYGVNWTARESNRDWYGVAMSSDGKYQTVVLNYGQIYTSIDYGVNWTVRESDRAWYDVAMSSDGKYQTAVVQGGQIYTSDDYGVNWTARESNRDWDGVAMSSDSKYQTAVLNYGQIYTSDDYGVNWTARDSNRYWRGIAMSSDGRYQTAVDYFGQIYTSDDYGVNWTARDLTRYWFDVAISSDGRYQTAVLNNGQIYISIDYGVNWTARESNRNWYDVAMSSDGKYQTAVVQAGQIYTSYYNTLPYTSGHNPAKDSTDIAKDINVIVHIKDDGEGIDEDTVIIKIDDGTDTLCQIYDGSLTNKISQNTTYGLCIRTGSSNDYTYTYNPSNDFNYSQIVDITIDASDLSSPANVMSTDNYSFTIIEETSDTIPPSPIEGNPYIYPNPYIKGKSLGEIITFANLPKEATIRIYTLSGGLIKTIKHKDSVDGSSEEWAISGISSGIYMYYIKSDEGNKKGKISIIK